MSLESVHRPQEPTALNGCVVGDGRSSPFEWVWVIHQNLNEAGGDHDHATPERVRRRE